MKIFILYLVLLATTAYGQEINDRALRRYHRRTFRTHEKYITFSTGNNTLFFNKTTGQLGISFPYSVTTKTGTFQEIFNTQDARPYSTACSAFTLDVQVGSKNHFFDFDLGTGHNTGYFSVGYGRNVNGLKAYSKNRFIVKPSINIGFYDFENSIGSIDAGGKIITVFGKTADSTFQSHTRVRSPLKRYNTKNIAVQFIQYDFIVNPKIAVEYHPFKNPFFIEFSLSYFLPFSEIGKIRL